MQWIPVASYRVPCFHGISAQAQAPQKRWNDSLTPFPSYLTHTKAESLKRQAIPRTDPDTASDTSPRAMAASWLGSDGAERVQGRHAQVIGGPERGRGLDERTNHRGKRVLAGRPVFDGAPDSAR